MIRKKTLILGANSAIAQSIADLLIEDLSTDLILVSRELSSYQHLNSDRVHKIKMDNYNETSICQTVKSIYLLSDNPITQVIICHGFLHNDSVKPEKRLEDFCESTFFKSIQINTVLPVIWIKNLLPLIKGNAPCKLVVFNARVGSISDNRLGGWHSYRSSKAALNMLLKNIAIEFSYKAKNVKVISFHPGTTDTPLSKPFQKNVAIDKLFEPKFVAQKLLSIIGHLNCDGKLSYLDWQGKTIEW